MKKIILAVILVCSTALLVNCGGRNPCCGTCASDCGGCGGCNGSWY
ncbi:hypothetical protein [Legionella tucsonensis]|nr:hypothetical protein [Legionella tucsonensis]